MIEKLNEIDKERKKKRRKTRKKDWKKKKKEWESSVNQSIQKDNK